MGRMYTWGSPEGVQAVINSLPERYPMELSAHDMALVVRSLAFAWESECPTDAFETDPDAHYPNGGCRDTCWRGEAGGLAATIAESVDVEWV